MKRDFSFTYPFEHMTNPSIIDTDRLKLCLIGKCATKQIRPARQVISTFVCTIWRAALFVHFTYTIHSVYRQFCGYWLQYCIDKYTFVLCISIKCIIKKIHSNAYPYTTWPPRPNVCVCVCVCDKSTKKKAKMCYKKVIR